MNLDLMSKFIERLRIESIGEPHWIASKHVFEYPIQSIEVAAVLKLIRAVQGIHSLKILCGKGLFVDMGTIFRCVGDCVAEVYFLLEKYPEQSNHVRQFLKEFFSKTIDGHLSSEEHSVLSKKIHNAMIRSLTGGIHDEQLKKHQTNVYKTFSGYVHAGYSHIMQMYGGAYSNQSFNVSGIPSQAQIDMHMQLVIEAYKSVLYVMGHVSHKFGLMELHSELIKYC
jgi:hypothetical protein